MWNKRNFSFHCEQGDQIGRIFACWGHCLLWAVFWKITKVAHIVGLIISTVKVVYQFFNGLGYILGDFFQKRIWSP
jgi:hypothetical protein